VVSDAACKIEDEKIQGIGENRFPLFMKPIDNIGLMGYYKHNIKAMQIIRKSEREMLATVSFACKRGEVL
jgi:hypothetical protein